MIILHGMSVGLKVDGWVESAGREGGVCLTAWKERKKQYAQSVSQ